MEATVCRGQTYALCAMARCTVYNRVAYCQCEVMQGDSISLPFQMGNGQDVCAVNAAGPGKGYMVSTFSLPASIVAPHGDHALYYCSGADSDGAHAQCNGGLCFAGSEGATFPGFDKPVPKGQIMCACPIIEATPTTQREGHTIMGPYPCDKSFFRFCKSSTANAKTGSTIYAGAPEGASKVLTQRLNGAVPALNECHE
jgi:hypothetical protein